jgi:hypothetical protein
MAAGSAPGAGQDPRPVASHPAPPPARPCRSPLGGAGSHLRPPPIGPGHLIPSRASLCRASLCRASLCRASLCRASLCRASLCRASLCRAPRISAVSRLPPLRIAPASSGPRPATLARATVIPPLLPVRWAIASFPAVRRVRGGRGTSWLMRMTWMRRSGWIRRESRWMSRPSGPPGRGPSPLKCWGQGSGAGSAPVPVPVPGPDRGRGRWCGRGRGSGPGTTWTNSSRARRWPA